MTRATYTDRHGDARSWPFVNLILYYLRLYVGLDHGYKAATQLGDLFTHAQTSTAQNPHTMNTLFSSITRSAILRRGAPLNLSRCPRLLRTPLPFAMQRMGVASNVSIKPGSQTAAHASLNVKEEIGNSATDLAKAIAGGNHYEQADSNFVSRTTISFKEFLLI